MRDKIWFLLFCLSLAVAYVEPTFACGRLSLRADNISEAWSRRMDLKSQFVQVVRSDSSKPCSYFITFTAGQAQNHGKRALRKGNNQLEYQIYQSPYRNEGQVLKSLPGTVQISNVLSGTFSGGGGSERKTYFFGTDSDLNPLDFPSSGTFVDSFTMSVYRGSLGANTAPDDSVQVQVRVQVAKMIALSLVPTGGAFRLGDTTESMDFGILKTGDVKDFDLRVITNAGYKVTFSSANNGVLRHVQKEISSSVPYKIEVDSSLKNLQNSRNQPLTVSRGGSHSETHGVRKNVRVTIGEVADRMAGKYQDVITIVATAVE